MLNKDNLTPTFKYFNFEPYWLPELDSEAAQMNKFSSYTYHQLRRVCWKLTNIRMHVEDRCVAPKWQVPGVTPAEFIPGSQTVQVRPLRSVNMYYKKVLDAPTAAKPAPSAEEQYPKIIIRGPGTHIFGSINFGKGRKMNFDQYAGYNEMKRACSNQQDYANKYQVTGRNGFNLAPGAHTKPIGVWLMPSAPYPPEVYAGGWQDAQIYLAADVHCYVTFRRWKPVIQHASRLTSGRSVRSVIGTSTPDTGISVRSVQYSITLFVL